ncbi:non-ribosomal peptide synthetase/type I polyketide synthase [Agrilutibacter solisilvae]|uniref:Amino acid adenylation domain-containing protein n=1 Tax=Agrilutibacter solisilvae TaxID=2763317 RepID=A0A975ARA6_9GAMM|nr:non-ribosomal peptide synthetase/type I polyketide synthase [Lysobacter solisilvae]QSX77689.1 amino acid adenylation domain-containing protein [Lysobacter solisilvae]
MNKQSDGPVRNDASDAGTCIPQLIEQQAARRPDAVAVTCDGASLSYRELNHRANQVAHRLRDLGVGPETLVAIGLERSLDMVVGLLGILKAGGAYLPVDSTYPPDRVQFMLEDARPAVLLTSSGQRSSLPATDVPTLLLDGDSAGFAEQPVDDPVPLARPEHLAYVIYTSGSTGKPKGCQVTHANVSRLFTSTQHWFDFGPDDVWTFFHSHAFDFSVWEIWGALIHGGRVVVVPYLTSRSPDQFHALLVREGVTVLNQTPSAFRSLIHADQASGRAATELSLRHVVFGGEALELQMLRPWFDRHGDQRPRLINMYGITETTVHVTYRPIASADLERNAGSVIGEPIPDLRLFVLDPTLAPVPVGEVGEIHVAGAGVSRGYLNRPDLTGQRFFEWKSPTGELERLYKTGDLARRLPDGDLEYLGRSDHQVKIRGFRIETGEIESVLARHPSVRSCAVIARDDGAGGEARLVAYVVPQDAPASPATLRAHLSTLLPDYMLPSAFVELDALPLTENGKLDRRALPAPARERPELACAFEPAVGALEQSLCTTMGEVLGIDGVGRHDNFFELGGDSLSGARLLQRLRQDGAGEPVRAIPTSVLFRHPTAATLAASLQGRGEAAIEPARMASAAQRATQGQDFEPVAIVAMAGRFPGAADVEAFWRNLCDGHDSITFFGPDDLDPSVSSQERDDPAYVRARGVIDGVEQFDAAFFGIPPREAELMDPQQRIFLELAWECMERAGHVPDATAGPVGVFAGMFNASYYQRHVAAHPDLVDKVGAFQVMLNNEKDFIATRVAHKLNLTGPAISVHTACSTSLVAICQAMDSLRLGHCDMALAGGVTVTCPPRSGYFHQEGAMLSPDGHTRTFDANAQGTVFSDGAAIVLLKRLSDAVADGNHVYAVIRGGAVNNDGGGKASFTAPSSEGQAAVIAMAHERARVDPRSIGYVEAHGTATPVGDPIEIEGLTRAFRRGTDECGFCRIGSVKSNVGHLVIAAGAAGVIKTAYALAEQRLPASLHFQAPNPSIDFPATPFVVNAAASAWPANGGEPRRAGVSSFGVGGTNAHVVLEEAPPMPASEPGSGPHLMVLSARTPAALGCAAARLADHLEADPGCSLADVAWTLAVGRKAFPHRLAFVADDVAGALAQLRGPEAAATTRGRPAREGDVVFLFPGQGATYPGMGRALYESEPAFRAAFDACADVLSAELGIDLRDSMFSDDPEALLPTAIMQPATFVIEYSLAQAWMSHGLTPAAMIGHSVGEFVAATLAGVLALPDALRLVARRGALMQAQPAGGMLSVRMPLDDLLARLPSDLSLAAENAPGSCVVSGELEAIATFQSRLEADGIACRALRTSHAFHSAMMEPVVGPFRAAVAMLTLCEPRIPIVSTATGDWLDAQQATSADYWASHLREPVRFAAALAKVLDVPSRVLLEVGPRATLSGLSRQHPGIQQHRLTAVATLADTPASEVASFRLAAGQLWARGIALDPAAFDRRHVRARLRLPTYPFERQRYWVDAMPAAGSNVVLHPAAQRAGAESHQEVPVPEPATVETAAAPRGDLAVDRRTRLVGQLSAMFEDVSGLSISPDDSAANFIELGLDSLMLTQVALQVHKSFGAKVTFRQLMGEYGSLDRLAAALDELLPAESAPPPGLAAATEPASAGATGAGGGGGELALQLIEQQMQLLQQQLALVSGQAAAPQSAPAAVVEQDVSETVGSDEPASATSTLPTGFPDGVVATTEQQREIWLADQLGREASLAFNLSMSLRFEGALDVTCLHGALQDLVDRHDALRSSIGPDGGTLHVLADTRVAMPVIDCVQAGPGQAIVDERLRLSVETPFALDSGPLFRAELLRLAPEEHLLLLTAHHIACDGWSWWVIVRELGALYGARTGAMPAVTTASPSYAQYALAEISHQSDPSHAADEAYWLSRFSGGVPVLDLPTDRPRPPHRSFASAREDHILDAELLAALRRLGARGGSGLFATLLTGFAMLLSRLSGQPEVVVGIAAAGQPVVGEDELVGHCVNLLPLRFEIDPQRSYAQSLEGAQAMLLDALEHQRYTFGTLLRKLRVRRDPARMPLVSVLFNLDQALDQECGAFPGVAMEFDSNPRSFETFELFVNAVQSHGQLRLECQYNTDLFDPQTVRRWLRALETMLRAAVERESVPSGRLPLVDAVARAELDALNPAPVAFERERGMHQHFEVQCDRAPHRIAVSTGTVALEYADLEARANRVAHVLRSHGIRRGALVGLALDRGVDMLAGLLGILKAGAGYVPLDPQFPPERLSYMAADAGLAMLLTTRAHAPRFDLRGRPVFLFDEHAATLAQAPAHRLEHDECGAQPEDPAYVIYTSGSTGRPKGVIVPHRAVSNFLASMRAEPGLAAGDRLLAVTTLSFDIAVLELLLPLTVGAQIVLADREAAVDGAALRALLENSRATVMQGTPSSWRLLIDAGWPGAPGFKALCGGEPMPQDLALALLSRCGSLWNVYGPTETTVWSTCARVLPPSSGQAPDIHIGRPIANTRVIILDGQGEPCPFGVPGELCIGGEGVTKGYLARPELTAERFLPDRFAAPVPTGAIAPLLYRTGDRARWRPDGNLEHLGRLDHQVKVRGYRIELGEIESNLAAREDVARAMVIVREDRPGDQRLVAYLVAQPGATLDESALRAHLRDLLPAYMLPQHFVVLDTIPLLPNGKIDRNALPPPVAREEGAPALSPDATGAAADPRVRYLADIWTELLGTQAGPDDNFFELGGHSMLAVQMAVRVERDTGHRIKLIRLGAQTLSQRWPAICPHRLNRPRRPLAWADGSAAACDGCSGGRKAHERDRHAPPGGHGTIAMSIGDWEPRWMGPASRRLYAALHGAEGTARTGVVLVPPLFHELPRSKRFLAEVASELSALGLACLRFDFHGTGDSDGDGAQVDFASMQQDLDQAIAELREATGVTRVVLLCWRGSALVLGAWKQRGTAADLVVLWEPIVDGANWLRELMQGDEQERSLRPPPQPGIARATDPSDGQLMGFAASPALRAELARPLDVQMGASATPVWLVTREPSAEQLLPCGTTRVVQLPDNAPVFNLGAAMDATFFLTPQVRDLVVELGQAMDSEAAA